MNPSLQQSLVLFVGGISLIFFTWILAHRRLLTIRFALGWITLGLFVSGASIFSSFFPSVGEFLGMTPTGFLLAVATVVLLFVCFQLSISISLMQMKMNRLIQELALSKELADADGQNEDKR